MSGYEWEKGLGKGGVGGLIGGDKFSMRERKRKCFDFLD